MTDPKPDEPVHEEQLDLEPETIRDLELDQQPADEVRGGSAGLKCKTAPQNCGAY